MGELTLQLPAPAKLNLFFNIVGRRADGYHELQTVFQLLDFCDSLEFEPVDAGIYVDCAELDLPAESNLVFLAARRLQQETGFAGGIRIRLHKRIPAGAGLGGGSSDAATTLAGLNLLWDLEFADAELAAIGLALGADVPVFLYGRSAWAEGIGDRLQPIDLPKKWFVVVDPGCSVSTAEIFARPDLTRHGTPITIARFLQRGSTNVCEDVVRRLYPPVDRACRWLSQWGPARMTGTGACVFLAVESEAEARGIEAVVPPEWTAFVAEGMNESPLQRAMDRVKASFR